MVQYKLYYFPFKGLGEGVRLIFHQAKVPFEDKHVTSEEWPQYKSKTTFGHMPCLVEDGKVLCESVAIARHIGETYGLVPKDAWERAKADELASAWADLNRESASIMAQTTPEDKSAKAKEVVEKFVKPRLAVYEKHFAGTKSGLTASEVCWEDFYIYNALHILAHFFAQDLSKYPHIAAFLSKIEHLPNVKAFIAERKSVPVAPMTFGNLL